MPPDPRDFYDLAAPPQFQQGDIIPGVLLINVLPSEHAVVVRNSETGARLANLSNDTPVTLRHEQAIDSFADGQPEHVIVSAQRGSAMIVMQTCDLDFNDNWLLCPIYEVEGSDVRADVLFAEHPLRGFRNLFGLVKHPNDYFNMSYVDLADIHSVHKNGLAIGQRTASLSIPSQLNLNEKISRMFGREWGYKEGDVVPKDGSYRCHLCNWFIGAENPIQELKKDARFPRCAGCEGRHKTAQWYQLQINKKY